MATSFMFVVRLTQRQSIIAECYKSLHASVWVNIGKSATVLPGNCSAGVSNLKTSPRARPYADVGEPKYERAVASRQPRTANSSNCHMPRIFQRSARQGATVFSYHHTFPYKVHCTLARILKSACWN